MEDDPDYIPLYKMPGPFLVMILVGLFFFGLFIGGFYWKVYVFPTRHGPWEVSTPGKYMDMAAFLLFSIFAFGITIPIRRSYYQNFLFLSLFAGVILFIIGSLVLF